MAAVTIWLLGGSHGCVRQLRTTSRRRVKGGEGGSKGTGKDVPWRRIRVGILDARQEGRDVDLLVSNLPDVRESCWGNMLPHMW